MVLDPHLGGEPPLQNWYQLNISRDIEFNGVSYQFWRGVRLPGGGQVFKISINFFIRNDRNRSVIYQLIGELTR